MRVIVPGDIKCEWLSRRLAARHGSDKRGPCRCPASFGQDTGSVGAQQAKANPRCLVEWMLASPDAGHDGPIQSAIDTIGPMRILIIEDDAAIADAIGAALVGAGHVVDRLANGRLADAALRDHPYDLVVLDLGLPDVDGIELLRRLRSRADAVPVLVATAREELEERVRALDLGADDYLVKPFALREFEARARALLRRSTSQGVPELTIGELAIDLPRRRARNGNQALELTPREFGLLEALSARLDRVVSREQLVDALCSWDTTLTDNGLDIAVYRLRRKLEGSGARIRTVRGLGYLLEAGSDSAA